MSIHSTFSESKPFSNTAVTTFIAALLAALMVGTRSHHFASSLHLPDASLAVFFLGGFYFGRMKIFVMLASLAALIDFAAIRFFGTSDFCISPAYAFLLPTYGSLWLGGLLFARANQNRLHDALTLAAVLLLASCVAFVISSGSFFLLSDKTDGISIFDYLLRAKTYFPAYVASAFLYVSCAAVLHAACAYWRTKMQIDAAKNA